MPADALAHADRLAASAQILLLRGEKRGDRTRALYETLTEFRQRLVRVRRPWRHLLFESGVRFAIVLAGLGTGIVLHLNGLPWLAVPASLLLAGALVWLKDRPPPFSPPTYDTEAEGDVEVTVEEIGAALARAAPSGARGGRFAHLQACYARAWDLVHWGRLTAYKPGQGAAYGIMPCGEFAGYRTPSGSPAQCAHAMIHQYWRPSLHDAAARERLARCDHAFRYLNFVPHARVEIAVRVVCACVPLVVGAFLGAIPAAVGAVAAMAVAASTGIDMCRAYSATGSRYFDGSGDGPYTRGYFAASADPLVRQWLGR